MAAICGQNCYLWSLNQCVDSSLDLLNLVKTQVFFRRNLEADLEQRSWSIAVLKWLYINILETFLKGLLNNPFGFILEDFESGHIEEFLCWLEDCVGEDLLKTYWDDIEQASLSTLGALLEAALKALLESILKQFGTLLKAFLEHWRLSWRRPSKA